MELLLISENKIKISLTKKDLDAYKITAEEIDYDNTETRKVFWTLLDDAKKRTGFDAAKSRIFIQIYPDRAGGCELYVSKIKNDEKGYGENSPLFLRELRKNTPVERETDVDSLCGEGRLGKKKSRGREISAGRDSCSDAEEKFGKSFDVESDISADKSTDTEAVGGTDREAAGKTYIYSFEEMGELISVCKSLRTVGYLKSASAFSEGKEKFYLVIKGGEDMIPFTFEYGRREKRERLFYIREHCKCICDGDAVWRLSEL